MRHSTGWAISSVSQECINNFVIKVVQSKYLLYLDVHDICRNISESDFLSSSCWLQYRGIGPKDFQSEIRYISLQTKADLIFPFISS